MLASSHSARSTTSTRSTGCGSATPRYCSISGSERRTISVYCWAAAARPRTGFSVFCEVRTAIWRTRLQLISLVSLAGVSRLRLAT